MDAVTTYCVQLATAPIHKEPSYNSECTSECLYGELLTGTSETTEWLQVRCLHDDYPGFVHQSALRVVNTLDLPATHWIQARSTPLFDNPSIKSRVMARLPFQSQLTLEPELQGSFARTTSGLYVWHAHTLPLGQSHELEPIALAQAHFLGAPYLWGGRSTAGLDCSGLVQALARARGLAIPRDSHQQEAFITEQINAPQARVADLVYWPGHVGMLVSKTHLLHATAHYLSCVTERLSDVSQRAGPISSIRRLFC
ncbi:MAG: NlpC/P60 family protein [Granulosicoccus sp.]